MLNNLGFRVQDSAGPNHVDRGPLAEATTLSDLMAALRRQALPLGLCLALGLTLGLVRHVTTPPLYYVASTVLVDVRTGDTAEEITSSIPFVRNDTSLLNEMQVLRSLQLAEEVTRRLSLHRTPVFVDPPVSLVRRLLDSVTAQLQAWRGDSAPPAEPGSEPSPEEAEEVAIRAAAVRLQRSVGIERIGQSFTIDISYVGPDPDLSAKIVNTYADAYLDDSLAANLESTGRMAEWMQAQIAELQRNAEEVRARSEELRTEKPSDIQALKELAQRSANLGALQQTLTARYERLAIQGSFPVANGRVLTEAIVPREAALPKLWQSVAVATILGLMGGFAIAVLRELRERSFRTGARLREITGKPFLGYLPRVDLAGLARHDAPGGPSNAAHDEARAQAPGLFLSVLEPNSLFGETLRNVHGSIFRPARDGAGLVIGVSSILAGEGKTTLAANYANLVAASGARAMLVDLDLHRATLSRELGCTEHPGVLEVLDGTAEPDAALRTLSASGLDVLLAAPDTAQGSRSDILMRQNMTDFIARLRKQYDLVVIDLPPLGTVVDAKLVLSRLDGLLLSCAWGTTPRSVVRDYLQNEPEVADKVLGFVLNKVDLRRLGKFVPSGSRETYLRQEYGAS